MFQSWGAIGGKLGIDSAALAVLTDQRFEGTRGTAAIHLSHGLRANLRMRASI